MSILTPEKALRPLLVPPRPAGQPLVSRAIKPANDVRVFRTCPARGEQFAEVSDHRTSDAVRPSGPTLRADPAKGFQIMEGFGGAFTEAAASTLAKVPAAVRQQVLNAYFSSENGNAYTVCRTHINSCDFALGNYAYAEVPGDVELKHFSIDRDRQALLPMIQDAIAIAGSIRLLASPWSPPSWMKTNGQMNNGGKLKPEHRTAWANYYCRYISEYARLGVPMWAVSVQNEPEATQKWDSCVYTGEEERDFVRDHLGPALARHHLEHVKIVIWDHNRDRMFERAKAVLDDPAAARYVWGTGFHWYCGDHFDNVQRVHDAWPDKALIFTEGCQEGGPHPNSIDVAERYARSIINDLNRWTCAWMDWNLVLDERGGPNHVENYCSAPILVDTAKGTAQLQPSYFYIGHFSRFVVPGSQRIGLSGATESLEATAFRRPDGSVVIIAMNRSSEAMDFTADCGESTCHVECPGRSIQTVWFAPPPG